jgi:hypothetical protein
VTDWVLRQAAIDAFVEENSQVIDSTNRSFASSRNAMT